MTCMLLSIQDGYNTGEEIRSKTVPCLCRRYSCRPMIMSDHICFLNDQNSVFPHSYAPTLINILSCPQYTRTNVSRIICSRINKFTSVFNPRTFTRGTRRCGCNPSGVVAMLYRSSLPVQIPLINETICLKNEFVVRYGESLPQPGINSIKLLQV